MAALWLRESWSAVKGNLSFVPKNNAYRQGGISTLPQNWRDCAQTAPLDLPVLRKCRDTSGDRSDDDGYVCSDLVGARCKCGRSGECFDTVVIVGDSLQKTSCKLVDPQL